MADEYVGAVMSDLSTRRGRVPAPSRSAPGAPLVRAEVPQIEITRYAIDLRSMSHGTGTFTRALPAARADAGPRGRDDQVRGRVVTYPRPGEPGDHGCPEVEPDLAPGPAGRPGRPVFCAGSLVGDDPWWPFGPWRMFATSQAADRVGVSTGIEVQTADAPGVGRRPAQPGERRPQPGRDRGPHPADRWPTRRCSAPWPRSHAELRPHDAGLDRRPASSAARSSSSTGCRPERSAPQVLASWTTPASRPARS